MTDAAPVRAMYRVWGGSTYDRGPCTRGKKHVYIWDISGVDAIPFLRSVAAYSRCKAVQARAAIQLIKLRRDAGVRSLHRARVGRAVILPAEIAKRNALALTISDANGAISGRVRARIRAMEAA